MHTWSGCFSCLLSTGQHMFHQLLSILAFCSLVLAAFGLGRGILRGLDVGQKDRLEMIVGALRWG